MAVGCLRYLAGQSHLQEIYFFWRPFLTDPNDDMVLELAVASHSSVTVEIPESLKRGIEALAVAEGYSLEQFLAAAAGEKSSVVLTQESLRISFGDELQRPIYFLRGKVKDVFDEARSGTMLAFDRITFDPEVMGGKACIRGLRITASLVVNLVANGMSQQDILEAYPYLEPEDIQQALRYAAWLAEESVFSSEAASA
jgi:uncharacterized protein (DUF433 family)